LVAAQVNASWNYKKENEKESVQQALQRYTLFENVKWQKKYLLRPDLTGFQKALFISKPEAASGFRQI
jgi:hypothetical protein